MGVQSSGPFTLPNTDTENKYTEPNMNLCCHLSLCSVNNSAPSYTTHFSSVSVSVSGSLNSLSLCICVTMGNMFNVHVETNANVTCEHGPVCVVSTSGRLLIDIAYWSITSLFTCLKQFLWLPLRYAGAPFLLLYKLQ